MKAKRKGKAKAKKSKVTSATDVAAHIADLRQAVESEHLATRNVMHETATGLGYLQIASSELKANYAKLCNDIKLIAAELTELRHGVEALQDMMVSITHNALERQNKDAKELADLESARG